MINNFLAKLESSENVCFGPLCETLKKNASESTVVGLIGSVLGKFVNIAIIIGGFFLLLYLLWGGLDWITSEGEKEKLEKAQKKIYTAIIGMIVIVASLVIFGVVTGDVLGIFEKTETGWIFKLPSIFSP